MKGYTFYLEHATAQNKRKGINTGQVIAATGKPFFNPSKGTYVVTALCSVTYTPNTTQLCWEEVNADFIRQTCTKIGEAEARTHHPNLFSRLENDIKLYSK